MASSIKLDWPALWKAVPASQVEALANKVAANVNVGTVTTAQVRVTTGTTEWGAPVALVTIMHPAGMAIQLKHGALSKAASSQGLTVTSTVDKTRVTLKSGKTRWMTAKQSAAHQRRTAK